MTGKIICHIGPPKTATTSLQIALDKIDARNVIFVGAFQPRERNVNSISYRLHTYCAWKSARIPSEKRRILEDLANILQRGNTIILSEELLLVSQSHASMQEKVCVLGDLLKGLPCQILVTARDPQFALPSYYQEIFSSLPISLQLDFSAFCRDIRFRCYDYEYVIGLFEAAYFAEIKFIDFAALSGGHVSLGHFTGKSTHRHIKVLIERHNTGIVGAASSSRLIPRISLKNFIKASPVGKYFDAQRIERWPGIVKFATLLEKISVRQAANKDLLVPSDVADQLHKGYLKALQRTTVFDV